jgi:hypothetical protein
MAENFSDHDIADPRIRQFALDCRAAGSTPEDVLAAAGVHRSSWFRWRTGAFRPSLTNWERMEAALSSARQQAAA